MSLFVMFLGEGGFECTACLKSYVIMIQAYISGVFGYRLFC